MSNEEEVRPQDVPEGAITPDKLVQQDPPPQKDDDDDDDDDEEENA